jgi:pilus assembly protein CpaF
MDDPRVEEIVINGFAQVVIYREDRVEEIGELLFSDDGEVTELVRRAIRWSGRDVNIASPLVTARLPDGSRLNAVIEPISAHGPSVAIRKFRLKDVRLAELVEMGVLPFEAAEDLRLALAGGVTLLFSGPTGSGKTTMLKALAASLRGIEERVITIEETGELDLPLILPHARAWEARPPNVDGKGEVTLRELVRTALRQRPKRLIIGEVRGAEALEMLLALDSGHDGSMGTIHANNPRTALKKLVMLASLADSPFSAAMLTETVAEVIGLVIHLDYLGSRRRRGVAEIFEATGSRLVDGEPVIEGQTLWEWSHEHDRLIQVGQPTRMLKRLAQRGIPYEKRPLPEQTENTSRARTVRP